MEATSTVITAGRRFIAVRKTKAVFTHTLPVRYDWAD